MGNSSMHLKGVMMHGLKDTGPLHQNSEEKVEVVGDESDGSSEGSLVVQPLCYPKCEDYAAFVEWKFAQNRYYEHLEGLEDPLA